MKKWTGIIALLSAAGFLTLPAIRAQPATASLPSFEVATIKPGTSDRGFGVQIQGRRLTTVNTTVSEIMAFAWRIHPRQITGGPAWMENDRYDLLAETGNEPKPDIRAMVQKLLADRFHLEYHRGTKELSVYQIVPARSGPKLADKAGDQNANPTFGISALGTMQVNNGAISDFAGWMQRYVLDRPVVDRTDITGRFTFLLKWAADDSQFGGFPGGLRAADDNANRPNLYDAVQQQLGLKLEATKAPVEVLVIDRLEKPSEN